MSESRITELRGRILWLRRDVASAEIVLQRHERTLRSETIFAVACKSQVRGWVVEARDTAKFNFEQCQFELTMAESQLAQLQPGA